MFLLLVLFGLGCSSPDGPVRDPGPLKVASDCYELSQEFADFGSVSLSEDPVTISIDINRIHDCGDWMEWELDDPDGAFELTTTPEDQMEDFYYADFTVHLTLVADVPGDWEAQFVGRGLDNKEVGGQLAIHLFGETFEEDEG